MLRERESTRADFLVGLLDLRRLKWGSSVEHSVQDYPNRPVVNFVTVASVGLEHLRRKVVGRTANSALFLTLVEDLCGEAEISNFETHAIRQEQIAELQVTVNNSKVVGMLKSGGDLCAVDGNLLPGYGAMLLQSFLERSVI